MPIFVTLIGWNPRRTKQLANSWHIHAALILISHVFSPSVNTPSHVVTFCPIRLSKLSCAFMNKCNIWTPCFSMIIKFWHPVSWILSYDLWRGIRDSELNQTLTPDLPSHSSSCFLALLAALLELVPFPLLVALLLLLLLLLLLPPPLPSAGACIAAATCGWLRSAQAGFRAVFTGWAIPEDQRMYSLNNRLALHTCNSDYFYRLQHTENGSRINATLYSSSTNILQLY